MRFGETLVEMARRHVREGDERIRRQRELAEHLEATQSNLAEEARALLAQFSSTIGESRAHLTRIEEEQRSGRRDANGDILPLRS